MKSLLKNIRILITVIVLLFSSCKKLITVGPPTNRLIKTAVFENDGSAISAIYGLYSKMIQPNLQFGSDGLTIYPGLSGDELYNVIRGTDDEFLKNSISPANSVIQNNIWASAYNDIYQCNSILEGLISSKGVTKMTKDQLTGEAKFIRAFCYFYLVNLFGDVPLITSTNFELNSLFPRTPIQDVYNQIVLDLKDAQALLSPNYPTAERVRPNKWAAAALLSRVYLYQKDYSNAENESSTVIGSGIYSLATDLNRVFLASSKEAIWQLMPVQPNYNTWEGNTFIPGTGLVPVYALQNALLASFEPGDQRKSAWIKSTSIGTLTYYFPYKYKIKTGTTISEYSIVLRYSEQYLIRAEARASQNNISGAQQDLNIIRTRAGLPNTPANDKASLISAITQERRVELFGEWGHRWFDLKRTGNADSVLSILKGSDWQSTDALYPIPILEIQRNKNLTQNAGY